jgi:hypothetical protein
MSTRLCDQAPDGQLPIADANGNRRTSRFAALAPFAIETNLLEEVLRWADGAAEQ